jgi:hypothetical protein
MRRIVVLGTTLVVVLGAAVSAYAATGGINTYTATLGFGANAAGSAKAPAAVGFKQSYIAGGTGGNRTAPLTNIKTVVYGLTSNGKSFPTCSFAKISAAKSDAGCPKGAMIATGAITATLGPLSDTSSSASGTLPCDPVLHVWNAGQGKVVYFFVDQGSHTCAGGAITTGTVGPFPGTVKTVGKNLVMNTPIPSYVSFPLAGIEGSLTGETLQWMKATTKVHGKTVAAIASTGCKGGKRPYSVTFTAESAPGAAPQSSTVTGSQKCAK